MTIHIRKQSQFELFPGASDSLQNRGEQGLLFKSLTLSLEHIIVLGIFFLMSFVLCFSLGVERGKSASRMMDSPAVVSSVPQGIAASQPVAGTQATKPLESVAPASKTLVNPKLQAPKAIETQLPVEKVIAPQQLQKDSYTIQVASFKTQTSAQREATVLKQKGFEVYLLPKGSHVILCVGKFAQREDANRFLSRLKNKYNDCLVRRI